MDATNRDLLDTLEKLGALAVAAATVYVSLKQVQDQETQMDHQRAKAMLGASQLYGKLAAFFGRQSMRAEKAYWEAVNRV